MKKYPYVLYITLDDYIESSAFSYFCETKNLHILGPNLNNYPVTHAEKTYCYSFNPNQDIAILQANYQPHISFLGKDLLNNPRFNLSAEEFFWFPTSDLIDIDSTIFSNYLSQINKPICLNYNPIIQPDLIPEKFRLFIQKIHKKFSNPLYNKELDLLTECEQDDINSNMIIIQKNGVINFLPIVLGVFGDYPVYDTMNFNSINMKTILRNQACSHCDFSDSCMQRGLGYIMHELKYEGCISIKLMQP